MSTPGPLGCLAHPESVKDGTLCLRAGPPPGSVGRCASPQAGMLAVVSCWTEGALATEDKLAKVLWRRIDAGVSSLNVRQTLVGQEASNATAKAHAFLRNVISQVQGAADWQTLNKIAAPILAPVSLNAGVLYGVCESLVGDAASLLSLGKMIVLAGIYERIRNNSVGLLLDPVALALAVTVRAVPGLWDETKRCDEAFRGVIRELIQIVEHPIKFAELVGKDISQAARSDWAKLKAYSQDRTVTGDFDAGRIMGRVLYQVVMAVLLVISVAGIAAKIASKFPWLIRVGRYIKSGGEIAELGEAAEGAKTIEGVAEGASEAEGTSSASGSKKSPKSPEDEVPIGPKKPSYVNGASDGGPGQWGKPTTPRNQLGAAYQQQVTGAPPGTEYKVPLNSRQSGFVDFDGYDPERNVLLDAKDYNKWPPQSPPFLRQKAVDDIAAEAADQVSAANGTPIEWHVPTQAKATELTNILANNNINGINVVVTPKP